MLAEKEAEARHAAALQEEVAAARQESSSLAGALFRAEARAPPTPAGPLSYVPLGWAAIPQLGDAPSPRICPAAAHVGSYGGGQWAVVVGAETTVDPSCCPLSCHDRRLFPRLRADFICVSPPVCRPCAAPTGGTDGMVSSSDAHLLNVQEGAFRCKPCSTIH